MDPREIEQLFGAHAVKPLLAAGMLRKKSDAASATGSDAMRMLLEMERRGISSDAERELVNSCGETYRKACEEENQLLAELWPTINTHGHAQVAWLRMHKLMAKE